MFFRTSPAMRSVRSVSPCLRSEGWKKTRLDPSASSCGPYAEESTACCRPKWFDPKSCRLKPLLSSSRSWTLSGLSCTALIDYMKGTGFAKLGQSKEKYEAVCVCVCAPYTRPMDFNSIVKIKVVALPHASRGCLRDPVEKI